MRWEEEEVVFWTDVEVTLNVGTIVWEKQSIHGLTPMDIEWIDQIVDPLEMLSGSPNYKKWTKPPSKAPLDQGPK